LLSCFSRFIPVLILLVPVSLHFNYIMNHLFVDGSGMADVGWFVYLFTNADDFPISNPEMAGFGDTYFSVHISPFFYVTTLVYQAVDGWFSHHSFFALLMGLSYSLLALSLFLAMQHRINTKAEALLCSVLSCLIAFNGPFLGSMGFPHFEVIIPSLILLVLVLYARGNNFSAILAFVFMLTVREDAGFHAALLFFILTVLLFFKDKEVKFGLVAFSVTAFFYSFLIILLQKMFFDVEVMPGNSYASNAFERVYSGDPFYAHLSFEFIKDRATFFIYNRAYLWVPIVVSLLAAIKMRNIAMVAGTLFVIPWALLSLTAVSGMPNNMANYYAFPFVIVCVWPVFIMLIEELFASKKLDYKKSDVLLAVSVPIFSIVLFNGANHVDGKPWKSVGFEYTNVVEETLLAVESICENKGTMGSILIDESVSALMPHCLSENEWGYLNQFYEEVKVNAETVIFYDSDKAINGSSVNQFLDIAEQAGIDKFYQVPGTKIVVGSERLNEHPEWRREQDNF